MNLFEQLENIDKLIEDKRKNEPEDPLLIFNELSNSFGFGLSANSLNNMNTHLTIK